MTYFKFFPKDLKLKGFQYKVGLNEDTNEFDSTPECGPGGLYYTDIHNLEKFKDYGEMIGIIKIPSDTPIVKIEDYQGVKYKSPKIDIIDIMTYKEFIYNKDIYQEEKMKCKDPVLKLIMAKEQTPEMCLEAVKRNGEALSYIKEQTSEMCL